MCLQESAPEWQRSLILDACVDVVVCASSGVELAGGGGMKVRWLCFRVDVCLPLWSGLLFVVSGTGAKDDLAAAKGEVQCGAQKTETPALSVPVFVCVDLHNGCRVARVHRDRCSVAACGRG